MPREHDWVIEFKVLGPLEVARDGEPVGIRGDKERVLLCLLAIDAGRVISSDALIDRLWGDDLPDNPANALQAVVSRLRRSLGPDAGLTTKKPGYVLALDPDAVDAKRFESLVQRATRVRAEEPATAARLLTEALALWRGEPFADLAYTDIGHEERIRLQELRLMAEEDKIDADLALGRHSGALARLESLVVAHPLRERLRAHLMLALYRSGRQADAITAYQETRRVLDEELGLDPSPDLERLYQQILRQDESLRAPPAVGDAAPLTNLPARITSFIGRQAETGELMTRVRDNRLVTIVGPGGAGKTSLAVEVGGRLVASLDDGVYFVELAPVADGGLVPRSIANAIGMPDDASSGAAPTPMVTRLIGYLRRKNLLLILDNCEHVVQEVAEISEALLEACPDLRVLATSREVLATRGEFVWPIPTLAVPDMDADVAGLTSSDAVRLFQERAVGAGAAFTSDERALGVVADICRRLDGLPLAIELAAARVRSLPLPELARRLDDRFAVLKSGGRTVEPRHRTLRAAIDWSYELLDQSEQTLLRRLPVFAGGWTLDAAERVCSSAELGDVLDVHSRLLDQSLISAGGDRFVMLETIRAYAGERLVAAGEEESMRERHARFFKDMVESAERDLRGPQQAQALVRLRREEHNLRAALQWGREHAGEEPDVGLGLAAALGWYWYVGRQVEGRSELKSMLAAAPGASPRTRAHALQALSLSLRPAGCIVHPSVEAAEAARESLVLLKDDEPRAAVSQLLLAVEGVGGGEVNSSLALVREARSRLRVVEDRWGSALANFIEMEIRLYRDSPDAALALGRDAAREFDALGDHWGRSAVRLHLGFGLRLAGRTDEAERTLLDAVSLSREARLPNNLARSLAELGELAVHNGDITQAERWFDDAHAIAADLGDDVMLALIAAGRGEAARGGEEPSRAHVHYDEALTLYKRNAVPRGVARALVGIAATALDVGDTAAARSALDEAVPIAREAADPVVEATALEQLARLLIGEGHFEEAGRSLDEADQVRTTHQRPRGALAARDVHASRRTTRGVFPSEGGTA